MNVTKLRLLAGELFLIAAFITACNLPVASPEPTATVALGTPSPTTVEDPQPTETPIPTEVPTMQPQAEHRIGVRQVDGVGEFYVLDSGETFVPRGANYVFVPGGGGVTVNLLKVGVYGPQRTRDDFHQLASLGYNTVRVFLDHCNTGPGCMTSQDVPGLNPAYLDNIADMMAAAREAGIFIQFTSNDLPDGGGYSAEANSGSGGNFAGYRNSYYLTPQAISATRRYWRDLLTGLAERGAAFDAVLGWQLLNEEWMFVDQPPLSLTSGMVETTTGSYDMSDSAQKTQMVSDGMVYYIAQMKEEILIHDPTALVTMGFFVPELAAPGWYVETASLLQKSDLDYFDFHAYPGPLSLQTHAEYFGMIDYTAKPIIMGEYGAFRHIYAELDAGARAITQWIADSCPLGFDGWLYWTYVPAGPAVDDRTWGFVDEDGFLLNLLAPNNHPDPCERIDVPNDNLAYNKPATASSSLAEDPPAQAVDDNPATSWNSGADAVQWIQIDLEGTYQITEIRLLVSQYPNGNTTHRIQVRLNNNEAFITVYEFSGSTQDNDWLVFTPETPLENVGQIRIQTVSSPSWVSWKEIVVMGNEGAP